MTKFRVFLKLLALWRVLNSASCRPERFRFRIRGGAERLVNALEPTRDANAYEQDSCRPRSEDEQPQQETCNNEDIPPLHKTPPKRMCLLVEPSPFTYVCGYANRFQEMLQYLAKAGDLVEIVTTEQAKDLRQFEKNPNHLPTKYSGYPIHYTKGFPMPLYNHMALSLDRSKCGRAVIERVKPDIIHVTSPGFMVLSAVSYAKSMRVPLVMSYHTHLPIYLKRYCPFLPGSVKLSWWLIKKIHSHADLTLVTSPQIRDEFIKHGISKVRVWRKGVNTDQFHPKFRNAKMRLKMMGTTGSSTSHQEVDETDFLIVYVGRLALEKRLKDLLPVIKRLPKSRLCFVGEGPYKNELQEHFRETKTHFMGLLTGSDLSAAYASADAFVMPSDSETLGFVVMESIASGVPVVGARAGGIPNIVKDGTTSFLVDPGDTDAFVDRLELLRKDAKFRKSMGKRARQDAEGWGWEQSTSSLRNVYYEEALRNFDNRNCVSR